MDKFLYLFINVASVVVPFIFSFHPRLGFNKKWRSTIVSIFIVGFFFIIWDIFYTSIGIWGFNSNYISGFNIFNLPVEEVLFFFCIPYSCLYTYHWIKVTMPPFKIAYNKIITMYLISVLLVVGIVFIDKWYTSVTFILLSAALIYFQFIVSVTWLKRLFFVLILLIIPFIIVDGILTGTGIESEIVWYNNNEIIGVRLLTIPIEDLAYGFLLILFNVHFFEKFDYLNKNT